MSLTLGMDTGGTYTDGVIIDRSENNAILCKAKSPTTRENLVIGIRNCIEALEFPRLKEVTMVALSTTLATNSVVEGKGGRVALFLMGKSDLEAPAEEVCRIKGKFDIMGNEKEPVDMEEVRRYAEGLKGKVEAVAISGYASVCNPKHELTVAYVVKQILDVPVVCAHQLSSALGFDHRTVTAVLNARLIPVIKDLMDSTRKVLDEFEINAPMMVVKGNGALMTEAEVLVKPIETVLSGPAASMIGAAYLTDQQDAFVLDMGGTTTDIANIEEGTVRVRMEGARVGGWSTRVRAAEISTFGIGGDSWIRPDVKGKLIIGPQRVIPLCMLGAQYPYLAYEMHSFTWQGEMKAYREFEADCYLFVKEPDGSRELTDMETKVLALLRDKPHSVSYLAGSIGVAPETLKVEQLLKDGVLARSAVTPTDILHGMGRYDRWNAAVANAGIRILAERMETPFKTFMKQAEQLVVDTISMAMLQATADFEGQDIQYLGDKSAEYILRGVLQPRGDSLLKVSLSIPKPIIVIGAPVRAWMSAVGEKLNATIIVPENEDVANAIGAAVGQVMEKYTMTIAYDKATKKYVLNAPWGDRFEYASLEEAKFYAIHEGRKRAEHTLARCGCERYKVTDETEDMYAVISDAGDKIYAGTRVEISGVGEPHTLKRKEKTISLGAEKRRFNMNVEVAHNMR